MNSQECWVEIDGFPRYLISNYGRVVNRMTDLVLSTGSINGYRNLTLCNNYGQTQFLVHRLMALTFFDIDITDFEVNHIDGDKGNNAIWNLELVTPSENVMHAHAIGLHSLDSKFRPTRVQNLDTGEIFSSISDAARCLGITPQRISYAIRHPNQRVQGFRFGFIESES